MLGHRVHPQHAAGVPVHRVPFERHAGGAIPASRTPMIVERSIHHWHQREHVAGRGLSVATLDEHRVASAAAQQLRGRDTGDSGPDNQHPEIVRDGLFVLLFDTCQGEHATTLPFCVPSGPHMLG